MIADAGALASSGYQKTSGILSLLKSFGDETEFVVWDEILTRISSIRSAWVFEDEKVCSMEWYLCDDYADQCRPVTRSRLSNGN